MKLMKGDCLELMKELPAASVNLILCDLPYGTTQNKWDSVIPLEALWSEYKRICAGAILLTAQTPFDKILGASNIAMLRYEWIWEKTNATGHLNSKKAPLKAHENVMVFDENEDYETGHAVVFYKGQPVYNPQMSNGHKRKVSRSGHGSSNYGAQAPTKYDSTQRYPRSVIQIAKDNNVGSLHPTQKPVALMEYLIRTYTNEGDTVLDNCMGSGTTGVACVNTARNFIGMEMDDGYFTTAKNRIQQAQIDLFLQD